MWFANEEARIGVGLQGACGAEARADMPVFFLNPNLISAARATWKRGGRNRYAGVCNL